MSVVLILVAVEVAVVEYPSAAPHFGYEKHLFYVLLSYKCQLAIIKQLAMYIIIMSVYY